MGHTGADRPVHRKGTPGAGVTTQYALVEYRPDFKEQIAVLQQHLWSADPVLNRAYFEWKYERNPYISSPHVAIGLHGDRLVAMRGLFGSSWEVGVGRPPVVLLCADDYVIAPEHRGSGLAGELMRLAHDIADREGFEYLLSTSAGRVTALQSLALGWRGAGAMEPVGLCAPQSAKGSRLGRLLRLVPGARRAESRLRSVSRRKRAIFSGIDEASSSRDGSTGDGIDVSTVPKPDAMVGLLDRLGYDGRIRHLRDAEYFAWRYRNPLREYRFLFLGGASLAGYLVLQRIIAPMSEPDRIRIVDWEATDRDGLRSLLRFVLDQGQFVELFTWEAAAPPGGRDVLREHGFQPIDLEVRLRGVPSVLVRPAHGDVSVSWTLGGHQLLDPASWDMRLLYSMIG